MTSNTIDFTTERTRRRATANAEVGLGEPNTSAQDLLEPWEWERPNGRPSQEELENALAVAAATLVRERISLMTAVNGAPDDPLDALPEAVESLLAFLLPVQSPLLAEYLERMMRSHEEWVAGLNDVGDPEAESGAHGARTSTNRNH